MFVLQWSNIVRRLDGVEWNYIRVYVLHSISNTKYYRPSSTMNSHNVWITGSCL